MDLQQAMRQFFNEKGEITLAPSLTLAGLGEALYGADVATGGTDRVNLGFWDFSASREGELKQFTRAQVNTRVKAVAARLMQVAQPGERVAILANNSPEYLFGFVGALYAGLVPIPLYDPTEPGHAEHLKAVMADSQAKIVLTNSTSAAAVRTFFSSVPGRERPRVISVDSLPDSVAASYAPPAVEGEDPVDRIAFLQYTSGSTRTPAGVVLTNRSIITNILQVFGAVHLKTPLRTVSWLPLHHDMGIILAAFMVLLGLELEIMAPRDFLQNPKRWINQINRRETDQHIYTVVPNFALELSARYGLPAEGEELDLSAIDGLLVGSEPVTEKAINTFCEAFAPYGLEKTMLRPSYGLAEASLVVTTPQTENRPVISYFDRDGLAEGRAVVKEKSEDTVAYISVGQVVRPQALVIVDPETKAELPDGMVGELWTHGENTAAGYLDREEDTEETFRNRLGERLESSRAAGAPDDDKWMATGDLAVIVDNEVYITGRLKDLIIIAGRNHYPQDIEFTVEHASPQVRPASVAAFAIEGDDVEKLIILAERDDEADPSGDADAVEAIRAAVTEAHGIVPSDIRIVAHGEVARSSSGKIARRVNKKHYLAK